MRSAGRFVSVLSFSRLGGGGTDREHLKVAEAAAVFERIGDNVLVGLAPPLRYDDEATLGGAFAVRLEAELVRLAVYELTLVDAQRRIEHHVGSTRRAQIGAQQSHDVLLQAKAIAATGSSSSRRRLVLVVLLAMATKVLVIIVVAVVVVVVIVVIVIFVAVGERHPSEAESHAHRVEVQVDRCGNALLLFAQTMAVALPAHLGQQSIAFCFLLCCCC